MAASTEHEGLEHASQAPSKPDPNLHLQILADKVKFLLLVFAVAIVGMAFEPVHVNAIGQDKKAHLYGYCLGSYSTLSNHATGDEKEGFQTIAAMFLLGSKVYVGGDDTLMETMSSGMVQGSNLMNRVVDEQDLAAGRRAVRQCKEFAYEHVFADIKKAQG